MLSDCLLDEDESSALEQHLNSCPACVAEVRQSGDMAVELAQSHPLTKIGGRRRRNLRGAQMNWQATPFEGVSMARLFEDPVRGELASLVRMAPGARYPSHHHASLEHCYVIEGDLVLEDHTLAADDSSAGSADRHHSAATTTQGCLLFIVHNLGDQVHAH